MRFIVLSFVVLAVSSAYAQTPECLELTPEQAKEIAKKGGAKCAVTCKGCGCKGGPGYRNAKGSCVGYARLHAECGDPPSTRCTKECTAVVGGCERPSATIDTPKAPTAAK